MFSAKENQQVNRNLQPVTNSKSLACDHVKSISFYLQGKKSVTMEEMEKITFGEQKD